MTHLDYFKPKTIEEALALLDRGLPLAGGTVVTTRRRELSAVVDLSDLGLDQLEIEKEFLIAGATLTLQALIESPNEIPEALIHACRLEAAWNIRNVATFGGTIMSADGRSPLLTVLLALGTEVILEPGSEHILLTDLLDRRREQSFRSLMTSVRIPLPSALSYEQVARSPMDRPVVCAAVAYFERREAAPQTSIALGGFGDRPLRVAEAEASYSQGEAIDAAARAAQRAYKQAGDAWASAEYRSHVAGVLVRRQLKAGVD
ncbi:MAG: hypothetical protein GTO14_16090 [Anaerolineales bacterium]|nr:hypothetical protein [Anaerolineales bacterium]